MLVILCYDVGNSLLWCWKLIILMFVILYCDVGNLLLWCWKLIIPMMVTNYSDQVKCILWFFILGWASLTWRVWWDGTGGKTPERNLCVWIWETICSPTKGYSTVHLRYAHYGLSLMEGYRTLCEWDFENVGWYKSSASELKKKYHSLTCKDIVKLVCIFRHLSTDLDIYIL